MMSQPGSQTIAIHMLPSISQSKGNQTIHRMNKINLFLQKIMQKLKQGD